MRMQAAVIWGEGKDWEIEHVDLDGPSAGEVLVSWETAGLCHSDEHVRLGDLPSMVPTVGGHEGAGIVVEVGEGVTGLAPGTTSWRRSCRRAAAAAGVRRDTRTSATSARS